MKKYNTKAVVLKNINYKDKDRIYTLFTRRYGKISALARGVRKISSRRSGNLDTLNFINVKITENQKGFRNIDEVETIKSYKSIKDNLNLSKNAYYITELLFKALEEDEEAHDIFDFLIKVLNLFEENKIKPEILVCFFELKFLELLGYKIPDIKLNEEELDTVTVQRVKEISPNIKSYIYTYLSDRFKSLEL